MSNYNIGWSKLNKRKKYPIDWDFYIQEAPELIGAPLALAVFLCAMWLVAGLI